MSRRRVVAFVAFIAFIALVVGVAAVGDALGGEKVKFRDANYLVKAEFVPVGDEEGHIVVVWEGKGICTNLQGKKFLDGWLIRNVGLNDAKPNSETWSYQGYAELTEPEGDKIFVAWEGKKVKKDLPGEGTVRLAKGTGKWQGIQGKGKWTSYNPANDRWYSDVEWDVEWPR